MSRRSSRNPSRGAQENLADDYDGLAVLISSSSSSSSSSSPSSRSSSDDESSSQSEWMQDFEELTPNSAKSNASKQKDTKKPPAQSPMPQKPAPKDTDKPAGKTKEDSRRNRKQKRKEAARAASDANKICNAPSSSKHGETNPTLPRPKPRYQGDDNDGDDNHDGRGVDGTESRSSRRKRSRSRSERRRERGRKRRERKKSKRAPTFLPHYGLIHTGAFEPGQNGAHDNTNAQHPPQEMGSNASENEHLDGGEIVPLPDNVPVPRFSEKWHDVAAFARPSHMANKSNSKALSSLYASQKFEKKGDDSPGVKRKSTVQNRRKMKKQIPSLQTLCARTVATYIDCVESFGCVPPDVNKLIATELARQRRLNSESLGLFLSEELTNLQLLCCSDLNEASLSSIATCHSLMRLELSQCGFMTDDVFLKISGGCPLISEISLHGAYLVSDRSMIPFLRKRPGLRSLKVEWMNLLTKETFVALLENCPSLDFLFVNECPEAMNDGCMEILGRMKSLTRLHIEAALSVSDDGAKKLFPSPSATLQHFSLIKNSKISPIGISSVIQNLPNVSSLCLEKISCADDNIVRLIANSCPNLRSLNINRCEAVTDQSIRNLVGTATLEELKIASTSITGDIIVDICSHGAEMRELDFSWCRALHDEHMAYVSKNCKRIQKVTLWGCTPITSSGVMALLERGVQVEGKEQFYAAEE